MNKSTHRRISKEILGFCDVSRLGVNHYAIHADYQRGNNYPSIPEFYDSKPHYAVLDLSYQDFDDIDFKEHHNIEINQYRIIRLFELAKESFNDYDEKYDALFHFCNGLHFLCDSSIPETGILAESQFDFLVENYDGINVDLNEIHLLEDLNDLTPTEKLIDEYLSYDNTSNIYEIIDKLNIEYPSNSEIILKFMEKRMQIIYTISINTALSIFEKNEICKYDYTFCPITKKI